MSQPVIMVIGILVLFGWPIVVFMLTWPAFGQWPVSY